MYKAYKGHLEMPNTDYFPKTIYSALPEILNAKYFTCHHARGANWSGASSHSSSSSSSTLVLHNGVWKKQNKKHKHASARPTIIVTVKEKIIIQK